MCIELLKTSAKRVIGVKQTVRSIEKGLATMVFVAQDAEESVVLPVTEACTNAGVGCETVPTMQELGKLCGIHVGAASAAILKD